MSAVRGYAEVAAEVQGWVAVAEYLRSVRPREPSR